SKALQTGAMVSGYCDRVVGVGLTVVLRSGVRGPYQGEASPRVSRACVVLAVTGEHLLTSWQKLLKGMSRNMLRIGRWTARGARVQRTLGSCILGALLTFGCGG